MHQERGRDTPSELIASYFLVAVGSVLLVLPCLTLQSVELFGKLVGNLSSYLGYTIVQVLCLSRNRSRNGTGKEVATALLHFSAIWRSMKEWREK
jgi:hypothetical protein